MTIKFATNTCK